MGSVNNSSLEDLYYNSVDNTTYNVLLVNLSTLGGNSSNQTLIVPDLVKEIVYGYIGPIICSFGIICNIINLLVLSQYQLKESPYTYLCGLACSDLGALFFSFIFTVFSVKSKNFYWKFYDSHIFLPLVNVCVTSSVWLTVMLTIERFLFVRHPLWAKQKCDRASAKVKVFCIYISALIINIPRFLTHEVMLIGNDGDEYRITSTEFRTTRYYFAIHWVHNVTIHFLPLIILSMSNIYLVVAVQKARIQRKKLDIRNNREAASHREQSRLTITLISIICLLLVSLIPSAFADYPVAKALFGGEAFVKSSKYIIIQYFSNMLVWCNLSLNFVLYCAFNARFRRVMYWMLQRWSQRLQNRNQSFLLLVNFRSGQSMSRNNSSQSQSNSITLNTKLMNSDQLLKADISRQSIKTSTSLLNDQIKETVADISHITNN